MTAREAAFGIGLLVFAAALRLPAMGTQLWLDEVWTLAMLERLPSALGVFTAFPHSNNHPLLSLWMYALGSFRSPALYRIPSFVAGVAAVFLAWRLGARGGRLEGALAAGLAASSSLLVHYSSEARGYELAIAFGLASFLAVARILEGRRVSGALALAACCALGLLSHLLYVEALAGAAAWLAIAVWRRTGDVRRTLAELALALGPAGAVAIGLAAFFYRGMELGAGEVNPLHTVLLRALSHAAGGPATGLLALLAATGLAAALFAGLRTLAKEQRPEWVGYLVATLVAPAVLLAATRPDTLPVRWFVLPIAVAYLPIAAALARAFDRRDWRRVLAILALVAFAAGNAQRMALLWRDGRGDYRGALRFLAEHDPSPEIRVGSDHDFRNRLMLRYYARELPPDRTLHYVPALRDLASWPPWVIAHAYGVRPAPDREIRDPGGHRYEQVAAWPSSDLSGFQWFLYRRSER